MKQNFLVLGFPSVAIMLVLKKFSVLEHSRVWIFRLKTSSLHYNGARQTHLSNLSNLMTAHTCSIYIFFYLYSPAPSLWVRYHYVPQTGLELVIFLPSQPSTEIIDIYHSTPLPSITLKKKKYIYIVTQMWWLTFCNPSNQKTEVGGSLWILGHKVWPCQNQSINQTHS